MHVHNLHMSDLMTFPCDAEAVTDKSATMLLHLYHTFLFKIHRPYQKVMTLLLQQGFRYSLFVFENPRIKNLYGIASPQTCVSVKAQKLELFSYCYS